ncbi:TPA: tail fiber assembly protein [Citrobacter freundii]|uniref:tail fiber assembly protein n=1 Tax=Enterobacteriaceae TaxID=543 RepID=UPI000D8F9D46|nr:MULTISPECIES: tail fiber assembly protein [Enterobacteriaceae]NUN36073.1 tail fiber assembly protein [Citrobacter freundii]SPW37762.1 tail fiber assembly protein from lambdoid prophage [Escherichia coli]HAT2216857.1 tail fiber assembly protein [Citrobacter freundii]HAT2227667.1 tail fiber assembly protein [Citrobacter freundii]HAT2568387.1 tail fiber assembly protein [Citrobacter freundii]
MTVIFDKDGLAVEAGTTRVYYFHPVTKEYVGWSDEFINIGVSMPGNSTNIAPGNEVAGEVTVFTGKDWKRQKDHRGETVWSTDDGSAITVDYIGSVRDGYTSIAPSTPYDKWDGEQWITDTEAQHAADKEAAKQQQQSLIDSAMASISMIQLKLQAGRTLTTTETTKLNSVLDYIEEVEATDTSTAPDVNWPVPPKV